MARVARLHCSFTRSTRSVLLAGLLALVAWPAGALPIGSVLISEVFYDAVGSDNGQSFIELWAEPGTILDGLTLEGVNGSNGAVSPVIALVGVVPDDGLFVVADIDGDGNTAVLIADLLANHDLQNGPDSLVLREGDTVLDALGYGEFAPDEVFAGEGLPAPDAPAGSSLARHFANLDSDDNFVDFAVADPSPGAAMMALPEPGSGLLSGLGVATIAWLRRDAVARLRAKRAA